MNSNVFISKSFNHMIEEYLNCKNAKDSIKYNSFFVVILRLLFIVYDELDIINPYNFRNIESLYENLQKYGYSQNNINIFFNTLERFYNNENAEDFINLQKMVIDMFIKKKLQMDISKEDIDNFRKLLYSSKSASFAQVSYNFKMTTSPDDVLDYYNYMIINNHKLEKQVERETLNVQAYELLKYSLEDINNMETRQLHDINKQVYNYFDINENAINKKYLLDKKIFDINHPKPSYSTGNGYVDILFLLAILSTVAMIIFIVTLVIF